MACTEQTNTSTKQNEFLAQLYNFHERNGTPIKRVPVVGGEAVDMYKLYSQVTEMGGFTKVTKDKQWNEIAQLFYQKHDVLNAGYLLKQHYIRFLMKFELTMKGGIQTRPLKSSDVNPHAPVVTPLNKPRLLLNNGPTASSSMPVVETATKITTGEFLNTAATRISLMHQNFDVTVEPAYYKLSMSLKSGLPNEVDFAFNTLTVLSHDETDPLLLSLVPSLLDLMLAHVGIYDEFDNGFKALHQTWTKLSCDLDYHHFWRSSVPDNVWSALMATERPNKYCESQELFHSYCGIGESTVESYRVAQVSNIIRNLSLEKKNVIALSENKLLLIFVVLCMNCHLPSVMRTGYEIAVNIASLLRITRQAEDVCSHLFIDTIVSAVTSGDRLQVMRGMEILGELAWCIDNAELLAQLPDEVYERILFCTLVPDVEMLHCSFETLYSLSSLDQEVTDRIISIPNSIRLLVQFLTFKSEEFEQNAINKLEIELPPSGVTKQTPSQGTPCVTSGITNLTVSPAQPLTSHIPQAQPIVPIKVQPERSFSLAKPAAGDGNFVSKWLKSYYEEVRGGMLSRTDLMQDFQNYCAKSGHTSGYTLMQLLRLVKMVFPSSYTRRIFDSNDVPQYVIGGVRKKMNIEWNFPSTKTLSTARIGSLPRQLSNIFTNEHRKIIPKSLNGENLTVSSTASHSRISVLSNNITSRGSTQSTRPLLPALAQTCNNQSSFSFNNSKIWNGNYKENMLNHSASSTKVGSFGPFPEAIQSLAHNKLLKAILPASSQIFKLSGVNELKSSQYTTSNTTSTNNCSTITSSKSVTNPNSLLNLITNNSTSQHDQNHVNTNSSKLYCYWEDCKSCYDTHKDLFIHCVDQHLQDNAIKCKWQGCQFTANRAKPSLLRHIEVYHCNATGKRPDVPSTTSILMNLKAFPMIELEEESKFTKSVRLTVSLILYNLLISSPRATNWLDPLIWKGHKRELKQEDLYVTPREVESQALLMRFNRHWRVELQRAKRKLKPRLWFALIQCFKWNLLLHGVMYFILMIPPMGQSILLGYLSQYFCEKNSLEEELTALRTLNNSELVNLKEEEIQMATRDAYLYAMGITLLTLCLVFLFTWTFYSAHILGMMHRVAMTGAIYSKVLKLSQSTVSQLSIGHIVNLASNDVKRFDLNFEYVHELWAAPLFLPVVLYLLWREIGPSCLAALPLIVLQPMIQYIATRLFAKLRVKSAKVTDKRIKVMNEIISGMRLIKMYAWEWAFHKHVKNIRRKESKIITQGSLVYACNYSLSFITLGILSFAVFSTHAGLGNVLTPKKVFSTLTMLFFIRLYFLQFVLYCLLHISEMSVAVKRIQKLLLLPELNNKIIDDISDDKITTRQSYSFNAMPILNQINEEHDGSLSSRVVPRILMNNVTASWSQDKGKIVLKDVNFTVDQCNRLLAVVGPVGSGKSSLLQCILRELPPVSGSVDICGTISYASQEPWIFSGTIKENILFGEPFERIWFDKVIECCSLVKDIDEMPFGYDTLIGERGVNLSGGQKARVNLARAVYRGNDIVLLDDPLSAVDAVVSRHLFDECICGVLADKLVILVTHQLQYAQHANAILVLKEGCVQGYGDYEKLTSSGLDPSELFDDVEDQVSYPVANNQMDDDVMSCESDSHLIQHVKSNHSLNLNLGTKPEEISLYTTPSLYSLISVHDDIDNIRGLKKGNMLNVLPEEERSHGTISNKMYFTYVNEGGNIVLTFLLVVVYLASEGSIVTANWWLSKWANEGGSCSPELENVTFDDSSSFHLTTNQRIGIFGGIVASTIVITICKAVFSYVICLNASRSLHNQMFKAILRAPILFFDTNPVGRVLNRFSADTGLLDIVLPNVFYLFFTLLLISLATLVIACVANYWLIIPSCLTVTLLLALRHYFLRTSRNIQRLEALARSPLYSHISATIQGLLTIRTYGEEDEFMKKLHFYMNEHSKGWHAKLSTSRWFGLRLDMIGQLFVTSVMFIAIPLADSVSATLIGLSMVYAVNLIGLLQFTVRTSAEMEDLLVSVERVKAYEQLDSEAELISSPNNRSRVPPVEWPDKGVIELQNVKFKYAADYPYILKSITLKIHSSEKVGIVGRTGAGKSSLLAALFRLAEPEGVLKIDGIQITNIGLHDLRRKISIIPQDPILFSGTVRYNLDPFTEYRDDQLWNVLDEVQLKDVVLKLDNRLEAEVSEGGSNFSVGQRQLICLARALLRRNKILVIDEATANVDLITDGIIQEMIRSRFSHCTILTIAHRLETIMDSDRVLVLSSGKIIEFDSPFNLIQKHQSVFRSMVERTGPLESARLKQIAMETEKYKI